MIKINRTTFFAYIRKAPFGGRLTERQVEGTEAILKAYDAARKYSTDIRHLAYILATAFHETGSRMVPVREGFAKTDAQARKITAKYKYGQPDAVTGHVYYGRGQVQLTWAENYQRMGPVVGHDLYHNPDLALEPDISAAILVEGMLRGKTGKGDFTGKSVETYFSQSVDDPVGARRIVNGTDKAKLIAGYYKSFLDALEHAIDKDEVPSDVEEKQGHADRPNLFKDPTTLGTVSAVAGSGIFGAFTAIDSPWAFAAFALVAACLFLFATGRIKIIRNHGG